MMVMVRDRESVREIKPYLRCCNSLLLIQPRGFMRFHAQRLPLGGTDWSLGGKKKKRAPPRLPPILAPRDAAHKAVNRSSEGGRSSLGSFASCCAAP